MYNFPKIIAHKAIITGEYQGNTLYAIKESLGDNVDGIEVDVRMSKDNVLFLYHGDTLEEYTNGHGTPENYTWSELSKLSYKDNFASSIVSLEEFFDIVGNQKAIFLDIKHYKVFDQTLVDVLSSSIRKYHLQNKVFVESFNPVFLTKMRLSSRDIILMYNFLENSIAEKGEAQYQFDKIPWLFKQTWFQKQVRRIVRPDVLGPRFNTNKKLLKKLVAAGYPLICWTVDDIDTAKFLYDLGVVGLQTNKPHLIQSTKSQISKQIYDAGGNSSIIGEIINISTTQDIINSINTAKKSNKKITIAGRRHSMGGQTLLDNSLHLNMLDFNKVTYNEDSKTITAQAGATWSKVQNIANKNGRSVKIMQSDNIFTVGGSVSVNVHGWQVDSPPISSTVVSIGVITADGTIERVSKNNNPKLFRVIIGGYGLFGVIVDVEFETVSNSTLRFNSSYMPTNSLGEKYNDLISNNPAVELAYARISVDKDNLFKEAGLFWFERTSGSIQHNAIKQEKLIALKRSIFRLSQYHNVGKKLRWLAEKSYINIMSNMGDISRNDAMNTDIHILWPLYAKSKDILHEYFVPKRYLNQFINDFRKNIILYNINILNVTIREVKKDNISILPYANEDVFALVCLFSQKISDKAEHDMKQFTSSTISLVTNLGGSFYLPYRLHYSKSNLLDSYPNIDFWLQLKQEYDPKGIFDNDFYQYIINLQST